MKTFKLVLSAVFAILLINPALAVDRLIIKYKNDGTQNVASAANGQQMVQPLTMKQINHLAQIAEINLQEINQVATGSHVIRLEQNVSEARLQQIIQAIKQDPEVQYVEEDRMLKPVAFTPGVINPLQWDMQAKSIHHNESWVGDNFQNGWESYANFNAGRPGHGVTVAVIDTGYTPHPNFINNLQQESTTSGGYGYQFISDCRIAGSCPASTSSNNAQIPPESNALDLGDYITQGDIDSSGGFFSDCTVEDSSWHGSHVTGIIVGQGYDSVIESGISGGAYGAMVVPVRVLGKCGGYLSDIENGIYWAIGQYPESTIANPHPAQVINMSLGGQGSCGADEQAAIDAAYDAGVIVVVAAGNSDEDVSDFNPANCNHVINVAAKGPTKELAWYSNFGATTITASGGDSQVVSGPDDQVYSTIWSSLESYQNENNGGYGTWIFYQGTSMATPHVAAAVADMLSLESQMSYNSIVAVLQNTATQDYTKCNNYGCVSSGALDVARAINYVGESLVQYFLTPTIDNQTISSITLTQANPAATVTFVNNNANIVTVDTATLSESGLNTFTMQNNGCGESTPLSANGGSCQITVTATHIADADDTVAHLKLTTMVESTAVTIANVGIATTANTTTSAGGGCTMISNGDDYSMLLILLLVAAIYLIIILRDRNKDN